MKTTSQRLVIVAHLFMFALFAAVIIHGATTNHTRALHNATDYATQNHPGFVRVECMRSSGHADGYLHCAVLLPDHKLELIECPGSLTLSSQCRKAW